VAPRSHAEDHEEERGFTFEALLPERDRRHKSVVLFGCCGGCCCCCCCCLHSVGGIVGAAKQSGETEEGVSAAPLFWLLHIPVAVLSLVLIGLLDLGGFFGGVVVLILALPLVQLAVAVVALVVIDVSPGITNKRAYTKSLLRITVGMVIGALVGGIVTVLGLLFFAFM
jgi:hypothetical protein